MKRKTKYGNKKIKTAVGTFDSSLEYLRWRYLKEAESNGVISNLRRQVHYDLLPEQVETIQKTIILKTETKHEIKEKRVELPVAYIADFVYLKHHDKEKGDLLIPEEVIEDTKSEATRKDGVYIIKRKLMRFFGHPIREVMRPGEEI